MSNELRHAAIALTLLAPIGFAAAQEANPAAEVNPASVPDLKLSTAQKQTIYLSISNQPQKETAPQTFHAAVGAVIPTSIELRPLPTTIVELIPDLKDYHYAMVANQVLLAHPKDRRIVEVITE
jgi:hypothetical protein